MVTPPTVSPCWDTSTAGCSGADGFLRCAVTYSADARVVPSVSTVAPTLRRIDRISHRDRGPQEIDPIEGSAEDVVRVRSEVTTDDLLVDRAEIDRVPEVAGGVEVGQARLCAALPALHRVADQQRRRCRAVVGAAAGVLFRTPRELRPGGAQDLVRLSMCGEVLVERTDRRVKVAHEVVVPVELGVVRVETTERDVKQLHPRARDDQLSRQLQGRRQLV